MSQAKSAPPRLPLVSSRESCGEDVHYYSFHIGDYASHTRHLSLIEDLAFRRLLDFYYLHEKPIRQREIARQIGMREYEQEVLSVLEEFFVSTELGYINPRADEEIEAFRLKIEQASRAGKASAERRFNGRSTVRSTGVQPTNNQEPLTNNHVVKTQRGTRLPTDLKLEDAWKAFCAEERPDLNPGQTFSTFRDYWISQPGQKGIKLDWFATWRNWVRSQKAVKPTLADIARTTVPGSKERDPALRKMEEDRAQAAPMPPEVKEKLSVFLKR